MKPHKSEQGGGGRVIKVGVKKVGRVYIRAQHNNTYFEKRFKMCNNILCHL